MPLEKPLAGLLSLKRLLRIESRFLLLDSFEELRLAFGANKVPWITKTFTGISHLKICIQSLFLLHLHK